MRSKWHLANENATQCFGQQHRNVPARSVLDRVTRVRRGFDWCRREHNTHQSPASCAKAHLGSSQNQWSKDQFRRCGRRHWFSRTFATCHWRSMSSVSKVKQKANCFVRCWWGHLGALHLGRIVTHRFEKVCVHTRVVSRLKWHASFMGGYKLWTFSETMDFLGFDGLSSSVVSAVCIAQNLYLADSLLMA